MLKQCFQITSGPPVSLTYKHFKVFGNFCPTQRIWNIFNGIRFSLIVHISSHAENNLHVFSYGIGIISANSQATSRSKNPNAPEIIKRLSRRPQAILPSKKRSGVFQELKFSQPALGQAYLF